MGDQRGQLAPLTLDHPGAQLLSLWLSSLKQLLQVLADTLLLDSLSVCVLRNWDFDRLYQVSILDEVRV